MQKLYKTSTRVLGTGNTNKLVKVFYGDIFVGGENSKELEFSLKQQKDYGLLCIADYAREFLTAGEEKDVEAIIQTYKDSIDVATRIDKKNSIAIKLSSFGDVEYMKKINKIQTILYLLEDGILKNRNNEEIFDSIKRRNITLIDFNQQKLNDIIINIRENYGEIRNFDLSIYSMLLSDNKEKYSSLLSSIGEGIFGKNVDKELKYFTDYTKILNDRLESVIKYASDRQCMIMVDAEQSYLQPYIDYITAHFFRLYNKEQCILLNTLQCYLKEEQDHYAKWKQYSRENNLKFGIKLVRGAYMNEESNLAKSNNTPNPVCENIEDTHINYNNTVENIFNDYKLGDKFIIATHNLESIQLLGDQFKKHGINNDIICAQLLGIAEHATGFCKQNNIMIAKYVPFGNFDILIPYLMRRAEESAMIQKLKVQNDLLNDELKKRFFGDLFGSKDNKLNMI